MLQLEDVRQIAESEHDIPLSPSLLRKYDTSSVQMEQKKGTEKVMGDLTMDQSEVDRLNERKVEIVQTVRLLQATLKAMRLLKFWQLLEVSFA